MHQAPTSSKRTVKLAPLSEWRFAVSQPPVRIRLLSGTAERDGTELAANQPYSFARTQSKLLTWHGCELELDGTCDRETVAPPGSNGQSSGATPPPVVSYLNLHLLLAAERAAVPPSPLPGSSSARPAGGPAGPRVLVCGGSHTGRTSLVRTLAAWATKMGGAVGSSSSSAQGHQQQQQQQQPCVVSVDPRDGLLSLPGTLSAAVFATLMDLETEGGGGWGGAPSSGPSAVPVKLPLVFGFGYARPADSPVLYRELVTRLAGAVTARMSDDPAVHAGGLLIDTPASDASDVELLAHVIEEFSVNRVVVLGADAQLHHALVQRLARETTTFGEPVQIVQLDASDGVVPRTDSLQQQQHEACIREYFFGDAKRTLDPYTQQVDFDALTVYRLPDGMSPPPCAPLRLKRLLTRSLQLDRGPRGWKRSRHLVP